MFLPTRVAISDRQNRENRVIEEFGGSGNSENREFSENRGVRKIGEFRVIGEFRKSASDRGSVGGAIK